MSNDPVNDKLRMLSTGIRGVLCTVTSKTHTQYKPWNQYLLGTTSNYSEWVSKGKCRGLSLVYLDATGRGGEFTSIATRVNLSNVGRYQKTWLQKLVFDSSLPGNTGDGDQALYDYARQTFGMIHRSRKVTKGGSALAKAVTSNLGYYLVSSKGHAMAVTARMSGFTFFDPNGGIIVSADKSSFKKALTQFFDHWLIKKLYGHGHKVQLRVYRFTRH